LNGRFNDATFGSTGWMDLTCLIRPTGWTNWLDDRSHDATVDPTVGPTGWTDRLVQQLDRVNAALACYVKSSFNEMFNKTVFQDGGPDAILNFSVISNATIRKI